MKRFISALALVSLGMSSYACGDDDDAADENTGGTNNAAAGQPSAEGGGDATTGGADATPAGGAPATGNVMCDAELDGVCQNPTDCPFVASGEARQTAGECGQTCLVSGGDDACPVDCMLNDKKIGMTEECATCYADIAVCGILMCAGECFDDPEAAICQDCLVDKGCRGAFNDCSGLGE